MATVYNEASRGRRPRVFIRKISRNRDFCENLILLLLKIDYADPKLFLTAPEEICYQSPEDQDPN